MAQPQPAPAVAACRPPELAWWHKPLDTARPLWIACGGHAAAEGAVGCLLSWTRRALIAGHVAPAQARLRLNEYLAHPDATAEDHWRMVPARREFYTAASDALGQLHPEAQQVRLADVPVDGGIVALPGGVIVEADSLRKAAIARLRTSRRLAGCLAHEPLLGVFDEDPGTPRRRSGAAPHGPSAARGGGR